MDFEWSIANDNKRDTWLNSNRLLTLSKNIESYYTKLLLTKVKKDSLILYLELSFLQMY